MGLIKKWQVEKSEDLELKDDFTIGLSFTTWRKITELNLGGASSVNITGLDGDEWDVWKIFILFTSAATPSDVYVRLNNDSSSSYSFERLYISDTTISSGSNTSATQIEGTFDTPGVCEITIFPKKGKYRGISLELFGTTSHISIVGGKYTNTTATITQVNISFNSGRNGKLVMYGLKTS